MLAVVVCRFGVHLGVVLCSWFPKETSVQRAASRRRHPYMICKMFGEPKARQLKDKEMIRYFLQARFMNTFWVDFGSRDSLVC